MKQVILFLLLAFTGACNVTPTPPTTVTIPAPPGVSPSACNPGDQAPYVYHSYRLTPVTACSHVIGWVEGIRQEADADAHLSLACVNDACKALLTSGNTQNQHGNLVVEFICVYGTPTQQDAIAPCASDPNSLKPNQLPQVGQCVWIDGAGVLDGAHGWGEIHPVGAWGLEPNGCAGMTARALTLDAEPDDGE